MEMFAGTAMHEDIKHCLQLVFLNKSDIATPSKIQRSRRTVEHLFRHGVRRDADTDAAASAAVAAGLGADAASHGGGEVGQSQQDFLTGLGQLVHIQECCATSGDGLHEGFAWLAEHLPQWTRHRDQALQKFIAQNPHGASSFSPNAAATAAGISALNITADSISGLTRASRVSKQSQENQMESQLEEWLQRVDEPDDVFLHQLRACTLDAWDHYTHLRIAFVLLRRHDRRVGMQRIFSYIKHFIAHSPRTQPRGGGPSGEGTTTSGRGTTFHETMTYFWTHMVHYAMQSMPPTILPPMEPLLSAPLPTAPPAPESGKDNTSSALASHSAPASVPSEERTTTAGAMVVGDLVLEPEGVYPDMRKDFKTFLVANPRLSNGGLFLEYYSKQCMLLDPEARAQVKLPDIKPLPSLLVDIDALRRQKKVQQGAAGGSISVGTHVADTQFWQMCGCDQLLLTPVGAGVGVGGGDIGGGSESRWERLRQLGGWGHESKLRLIFLLLLCFGRAGSAADLVLQQLAVLEGAAGVHYSINYFWMQMVTYHIALAIKHFEGSGGGGVIGSSSPGKRFAAFNDPTYTVPSALHDQQACKQQQQQASLTAAEVSLQSAPPSAAPSPIPAANTLPAFFAHCDVAFSEFLSLPCSAPLRDALLYDSYYSRAVLDSEAAKQGLSLPDVKPFPSIVL